MSCLLRLRIRSTGFAGPYEKLKTAPENVSKYLKEAVNYLDKFWNEIFAYLKDGNYPIDNNTAERSIRKLIT